MVAQVVGQDVVAGVVEDLVVRYEVHFEAVAARRPVFVPGLKMGGHARSAESHRVVGDDQLARPSGGDEPSLERDAVKRGECDVLVRETVLRR
jgi:hypothetical protein